MKVKCNMANRGKCDSECYHADEHDICVECVGMCPRGLVVAECSPTTSERRYPRESTMEDENVPVVEQYKKGGTST